MRRLAAEAERRRISVDSLIQEMASTLPTQLGNHRRSPAFVAIGASKHGISDRISEVLAEGFGTD